MLRWTIALGMLSGVFVAVVGATAAAQGLEQRASVNKCAEYTYGGVEANQTRSGARAKIVLKQTAKVAWGHAAAWVGVGGPGKGPSGTDQWLQSGYAGFDTGETFIYYEVTKPNKAPQFHPIGADIKPGESHEVAVFETKKNTWRVKLDGKWASPEIVLPESDGTFKPQLLGESWSGGTGKCNQYQYEFKKVQLSSAVGGSWVNGKAGYIFKDAQTKKLNAQAFSVRATASASAKKTTAAEFESPLLGQAASRILGRNVAATCEAQAVPVREQPVGQLHVGLRTCWILLGYAQALPKAPRAGTPAAREVVIAALDFLRGVQAVNHAPPSKLNCKAIQHFYGAFRRLGATPSEDLALRKQLLEIYAARGIKLKADC